MAKRPEKFIAGAIKRPGSFKAYLVRLGIIKSDAKVTRAAAEKGRARARRGGNKLRVRQANFFLGVLSPIIQRRRKAA